MFFIGSEGIKVRRLDHVKLPLREKNIIKVKN
jgi:hypothetical protein